MPRKKGPAKPKLKLVEIILSWGELRGILDNYVGKTIEFVTGATSTGEITRIEIIRKNTFMIYYKNVFSYKQGHGWVFESEEEQSFEVILNKAKVMDKGQGTIQIEFNDQASIFLKQKQPKAIQLKTVH